MWKLDFRLILRSDAVDTKFTTKTAGQYGKMVQVNFWAKEFRFNHPGFLQAAWPFLACLLLLAQKNTWADWSELQLGSAETQLVFTELPVRDKLPASMPAPPQVATDDIVTYDMFSRIEHSLQTIFLMAIALFQIT